MNGPNTSFADLETLQLGSTGSVIVLAFGWRIVKGYAEAVKVGHR